MQRRAGSLLSDRRRCAAWRRCCPWLALVALVGGCGGEELYSNAHHVVLSLEDGDLQRGGLALITPSTVTGQEEDKQTLALVFAEALSNALPGVRVVPLSQTLSVINRADLSDAYERMFDDARDTGVLNRTTLRAVGEHTGARYLAQLKLAGFAQESLVRWSFLGVRMLETKRANIRLFLQIWDSADGSIAWEGAEEMTYAVDTASERVVTLHAIATQTARNLIARLPGAPPPPPPPPPPRPTAPISR